MMARYIVTPAAGPQVAGRRAAIGDILELSAAEARYELLCGTIAPAPEDGVSATPDASARKRRRGELEEG